MNPTHRQPNLHERVYLRVPYEDKEAAKKKRQSVLVLALLALTVAAIWTRWDATKHPGSDGLPRYFWQERPATIAPAVTPAAVAPKP